MSGDLTPRGYQDGPARESSNPVVELGYHLLGLLLGARRLLLVGGGIAGFVVWLVLVHAAAGTAAVELWAPAIVLPLLLGLAGHWLLDQPPGVVFRAARPWAGATPEPTRRCLASGLFETERGPRWRLLARAGLTIERGGALRLISPPPLGEGRAVELAFPMGERLPLPGQSPRTAGRDWLELPQAVDAGRWRGSYATAADYAETHGEMRVPRGAIVACALGWQYACLRRRPAVRLTYRDEDDAVATLCIAFPDEGQARWLARALDRG